MQLVGEIILRLLKLFHGLSHAAGELRKTLRAEENKDDQQDNEKIRAGQVTKKRKHVHDVGSSRKASAAVVQLQVRGSAGCADSASGSTLLVATIGAACQHPGDGS
jgi:hypothetical protein